MKLQAPIKVILTIFIIGRCIAGLPCARAEDSNYPQVRRVHGGLDRNVPEPEDVPIDLPTVLRLAGTDSLDVKFAEEQLNEARARRLETDMQFLPYITPAFEKRWHYGRVQSTIGQFQTAHNKVSATEGVEAALDLHLGESVYASLAARRRVEASTAGVQVFTDAVRLQAVAAYFNLVLARANQAIVEDRLKEADETIRLAQELLKGGKGLLSEVRRSEAARAEVEQRLAAAKEDVRNASLALTEALYIDPLVTLVPTQQPQEIVTLVPADKKLTDLVTDAVTLRPELAESRALWGALDREKQASIIAPLIPTISAHALTESLGPHPNRGEGAHDYYVGAGWKIGSGGIGDVGRMRIAESRLRQEGIRFDRIADQIMREVVASFTRVDTSKVQIESAKKEVAAAEESLRLTQERLKTGTALTLEVLTAEDALFSARARAANDIAEFNKAQYSLLRSIGGFHDVESISGNGAKDGTKPQP